MRFKRILLEREKKKKFLNDCASFIDKNQNILEDGLSLIRGTFNSYEGNFIEKDYRERREVRGQQVYTYLYEKFKPSGIPSREKTVPCFYDTDIDEAWTTNRSVYHVFPIGRNYQLVYTDDVEDFNSRNPFFQDMANPRDFLRGVRIRLENLDISEFEVSPEFHQEIVKIIDNTKSRDYDEIIENYDYLINYIESNEEKIRPIVDEALYSGVVDYDDWEEKWEKTKEKMKIFFNQTHTTKKLPSQEGLEVNLFPPSGFYYVEPSIFDELFR